MTISYSGNFCKLLFRWRGSVWQAVCRELTIFLILYYCISAFYRLYLKKATDQTTKEWKDTFDSMQKMFNHYTKFIPLTFLLGFYINAIIRRWISQFDMVAWPDNVISYVNFILPESDTETRRIRHQIARYLCLTCALAWRDISVKVRQRFPTMDHVVQTGLMTNVELNMFNSIYPPTARWRLPVHWSQKMIRKVTTERNVMPAYAMGVLKEMNDFQEKFRQLYCFDWVCVPLVYTQVAAIATYGFFAACLIGRQSVPTLLNPHDLGGPKTVDFWVPAFTILQFIFYVGWFKVGQVLMRPFGTDDDDIELNYILDRHVKAAFSMVHDMIDQEPPILTHDKFWDINERHLKHTKISATQQCRRPKLHAHVDLLDDEAVLVDEEEMEKAKRKSIVGKLPRTRSRKPSQEF